MVPIARRHLLAEKSRFVLAVFGVAVSVFLIVLIQSLFMGFRDRFGAIVEDLPFDVWVVQDGSYDLFRSTSLLPSDYAATAAEISGVLRAEPIMGRRAVLGSGDHETQGFVFAFPSPEVLGGVAETERSVPSPGEIVLSAEVAHKIGAEPGDTASIGEHSFLVSAVVPSSFSTLHMEDARAAFGTGESINYVGITVADGFDPQVVGTMIGAGLAEGDAVGKEDFANRSRSVIDSFTPVLGVLLAVGFIVGVAIISLTIYTSTIEKAKDFGVLKALGATRGYLYKIVTTQSLTVGLFGFALGTPTAYGAAQGIAEIVPEFVTIFNPLYVAGVLLVVLLMSGVSSLLPVHRISRVDPGMVFRA